MNKQHPIAGRRGSRFWNNVILRPGDALVQGIPPGKFVPPARSPMSKSGAQSELFLIDETLLCAIVVSSSSQETKRENREFHQRLLRKHSPLTPSFQKFSVFERFLANFAPEFPENEGEKWQHLQPSPSLVAFP